MDRIISQLIKRFKTNDPFTIARGLNILIRYADFEDGTRGLYYRVLRRRFIVLHSGLDEHWQRFVCAHELGHDRLHPGYSRFWLDENSLSNPGKYERQANRFAIQLLTAGDTAGSGEAVCELLRRNGVPEEMRSYYY
ncbi:ImmA/IrrE family metallo-endopeptidase [Paenibacillus sp. J31TS4]|uniref:ImmA/IrrE family metallo-endopeptidase n=1 Tax=Paenibacillus sp. J31TS4 TaxID=2807195 RepID=UPI001B15F171|nr:ImmA/IrrE family metallo-endopeptidase [Paenibacillus sp. J31TS4]GIP38339.1 ImmA/IrrE family metallo-endopeptidase [Paenibacillus sp. J31TS4]